MNVLPPPECPHGVLAAILDRPDIGPGWVAATAPSSCEHPDCYTGKVLSTFRPANWRERAAAANLELEVPAPTVNVGAQEIAEEPEAQDVEPPIEEPTASPEEAHGRTHVEPVDIILAWVSGLKAQAAANASRITEAFSRLAGLERFGATTAALERLAERFSKLEQDTNDFMTGEPQPAVWLNENVIAPLVSRVDKLEEHSDPAAEAPELGQPRRLVLVESPYRGGGGRTRYAEAAMLDCLARGEAPMLSHLLYTRVLDDDVPADRHTGMLAGWSWLKVVDALVVYTDMGISDGMCAGILRAEVLTVPVEHRKIQDWKTTPWERAAHAGMPRHTGRGT